MWIVVQRVYVIQSILEFLRKGLETLRQKVAAYQPPKKVKVPQANILLVGQVGAGKSSFCNTVNSLFRGFVTPKAVVGSEEQSVTTVVSFENTKSEMWPLRTWKAAGHHNAMDSFSDMSAPGTWPRKRPPVRLSIPQ